MTRLLSLLAVVTLAVPASAADKPAAPNTVLRVRSLKDLLDDARYVAKLEGGEQAVKSIDDGLDQWFGKDRAGLDLKKPAGGYATVSANNVDVAVMLLPIADRKVFLDRIKLWFGDVQEQDGIYSLRPNWFTPRFFRFANGYVYVSWMSKDPIAGKELPDPAKVLDTGRDATLSLLFTLDGVPKELKTMSLEGLNRLVAWAAEGMPGETDLQRKLRAQVVRSMSGWMGTLADDGERLELTAGVDRQRDELYAEVYLSGKPQSRLAESIAQLGQLKSRFAGLQSRNAMKLLLHWTLSEDLTEAVRPVVDETIRTTMRNAAAETIREQAAALCQAIDPSLKPGELDVGFQLLGPNSDGKFTMLLGLKVREGAKLDAAVRNLVKSLPETDRAKFKFDVANAMPKDGKPASIHRAELQEYLGDQFVGGQPVFFSIGDDAAWLVLGPNGLATLKEAMSAGPTPGPLVQYEVGLARLLPLLVTDIQPRKEVDKAAREILAKNPDADLVRFSIEGGKALKARVTMQAPAITFLSRTQGHYGPPFWWRLFR